MQKILIADTETTSVAEDAEIVELAFLEVDEELNILDQFSSLVQPKGLISPEAAGASGITNRMVHGAPTLGEILTRFPDNHFDDVFLACHNVVFDLRFLRPVWNITGSVCTLRGARKVYPDSPNHKLQTLRHYLEIELDVAAHRAMADVLTTYELLKRMMDTTGKGLDELFDYILEPVEYTAMPFGKHKGLALSELPRGYVRWLLELPELEDDLRQSLLRVRR